jgi:hypothetical protein
VNISDTLRERLGVDIGAFAGANAVGEIPLSDELINRQIAERLASNPKIAGLQVAAQDGDVVVVHVVPRVRLIPPQRIVARIERQPQFPQQPMLLLRWSMPSAGPLAVFAAPILSYFKAMPPGIQMDGDRLAVDVRELLRSRGLDELNRFIRRLEVHTRAGGFIVQFELGI